MKLKLSELKWLGGAALFTIMPSIGSIAVLSFVYNSTSLIQNWIEFPYLFFLIASLLMGFSLCPTTIICLVGGYLSSYSYFPLFLIAYGVAAFIGKYWGRAIASNLSHTNEGKWEAFLNKHQGKSNLELVFWARLSPILPFSLSNYLLGGIQLSNISFVAASLLGTLPRSLALWIIGVNGKGIQQLFQHNNPIWMKALVVALILGSSYGIYKSIRKKLG